MYIHGYNKYNKLSINDIINKIFFIFFLCLGKERFCFLNVGQHKHRNYRWWQKRQLGVCLLCYAGIFLLEVLRAHLGRDGYHPGNTVLRTLCYYANFF